MLTQKQAAQVDEYLMNNYTLSQKDNDYLDDIDMLILECSLKEYHSEETTKKLLHAAEEVYKKMTAYFTIDTGCSPRVLAYQDRYYSLMYIFKKARGEFAISELAMQCFTSSFDLFWLQTLAKKEQG